MADVLLSMLSLKVFFEATLIGELGAADFTGNGHIVSLQVVLEDGLAEEWRLAHVAMVQGLPCVLQSFMLNQFLPRSCAKLAYLAGQFSVVVLLEVRNQLIPGPTLEGPTDGAKVQYMTSGPISCVFILLYILHHYLFKVPFVLVQKLISCTLFTLSMFPHSIFFVLLVVNDQAPFFILFIISSFNINIKSSMFS